MTRTTRALDWRDVVIHLIVTLIGIFLAEFSEEGLIPLVMLASAVIFVLRWVIPAPGGASANEADGRLAEVEERLRYLEGDHERMIELEERLDFAERLLARQQEGERLLPGSDATDR